MHTGVRMGAARPPGFPLAAGPLPPPAHLHPRPLYPHLFHGIPGLPVFPGQLPGGLAANIQSVQAPVVPHSPHSGQPNISHNIAQSVPNIHHSIPSLPLTSPGPSPSKGRAANTNKALGPHPVHASPFPGFPVHPTAFHQSRFPAPPAMASPFATFMFSQEDLDMILYGYTKNRQTDSGQGHALSGLRVGELSYGMDRILRRSPGSSYSPVKPSQTIVDSSSLDLPDGIELLQTTFAGAIHYGVFVKKPVIPKGTRFGPFRGRQVNTSEIKTNDDNSLMWEIFQDGKLNYFVDGRGSAGNWMAYVNCARYAQEQNLLALQSNREIFYEACKDIPQGTELLVWYGDCYLQFMGIPIALKDSNDAMSTEIENSEGYTCERCGKVFAYRYYRDKHLKYTRCVDQGDRKFPCHLCTRSFEKRDRLRIHILHVHEKHRPHKCTVCNKSFSQSSSLNKHMRVHSGERPYKCVYCSKAFTASSILRTHIRQHSGEKPFKCKHCGKAFASHAAHDSHVRRTHVKDKQCACSVCGKIFQQPYELKFHMNMHAGEEVSNESVMSTTSERSMPGMFSLNTGVIKMLAHDINMNDKHTDDNIDVVGVAEDIMAPA